MSEVVFHHLAFIFAVKNRNHVLVHPVKKEWETHENSVKFISSQIIYFLTFLKIFSDDISFLCRFDELGVWGSALASPGSWLSRGGGYSC